MEKKIVYQEVCSAQELQALDGATITAVYGHGADEDEGLCIDCDKDGNLVSLLILEDGTWHFHDSKDYVKKNLTIEQYGKLTKLIDDPMVDSVHVNNAAPTSEIIIKVFGRKTADRVLTEITCIFPMLEIGGESEWDFEGRPQPMFSCYDPEYSPTIVVAVMPEDVIKDIGGN